MPETCSTNTEAAGPASLGFTASFYQTSLPAEPPGQRAALPRTSYSGQTSGGQRQTFAEFRQSSVFAEVRDQFVDRLEELAGFARNWQLGDAARIEQQMNVVKAHLLDHDGSYFGDYQAQLFGFGKRSLDAFCARLSDEQSPLASRVTALRNLVDNITVCGPRMASELAQALGTLERSCGGIQASARQAQETMIEAHLQHFVRHTFGGTPDQEVWLQSMESHYVDQFKRLMGLPGARNLPNDPFMGDAAISEMQTNACMQTIASEITPCTVAQHMAEQCMQGIRETLARELKLDADGAPDLSDPIHFMVLERAIGQACERFGNVNSHSVVQTDDDGNPIRLRSDCTLIALDLLDTMHKTGLVDLLEPETILGWKEGRIRYAVQQVGQRLCYVNEESGEAGAGRSSGTRNSIGVKELRRLDGAMACATHGALSRSLNSQVGPFRLLLAEAAIASDDLEHLRELPAAWLGNTHLCERFLARMGPANALTWLSGQPQPMPIETQDSLAVAASRAGQQEVLLLLSPPRNDPADARAQWQRREGAACLSQALHEGDAQVLKTWIDLLIQAAPALQRRHVFGALQASNAAGLPGLNRALQSGHAATVRTFNEGVLRAHEAGSLDAGQIENLLAARRPADGVSGLMLAMQNGHAEAVQAVIDSLLSAHSRNCLDAAQAAQLLTATRTADGISGLMLAMQNGHAEATKVLMQGIIRARQAGILDPLQVEQSLEARRHNGAPGLLLALQNGHADVVRAFVAGILQAEQARCLDGRQVAKLLTARRPDGVPGLMFALENGHTAAVQACTAGMLQCGQAGHLDPRQTAELLSAKRADGVSGLMLALHAGHAPAVKAFVDAVIQACHCGCIAPDQIAPLLAARRVQDAAETSGLVMARANGHLEAVQALADGVACARKRGWLRNGEPLN